MAPVDPSKIRKANQSIPQDAKLVLLNHFKHESNEDKQTSPWCHTDAEFTASFGEEQQGPMPDKKRVAGYVTFFVEQLGTAPTLVLEYHFETESRTGIRKAKSRLEFAFNKTTAISSKPADKLEDRLIERREISDFDLVLTGNGADISFTSQGGRVHDVYCYTQFKSNSRQVIPKEVLTPEQLWVLSNMERIAKLEPGKTCTINIKLIEDFDIEHHKKRGKKSPIMQLADMIPSKSNGKVDPFFQGRSYSTYRNKQGKPSLQFGQTPARAKVFRSPHPGAPIPAPVIYKDHEEYAIHLSIGLDLLNKEQKMFYNTITKHEHRAMVLAAGSFAVASIKLSRPLASDLPKMETEDKLTIPADTMVKLTMYGQAGVMKKWHATGVVQADVYGFASDLFVLILDKSRKDLSSIIMDQDAHEDLRKFLNVHVEPMFSDVTTKMGMDAVNSAFSIANKPDNPNYVPAMFTWPLLYNGEQLPERYVFESLDARTVTDAWKKLRNVEQWDNAQRAALYGMQDPMAGIQLFTGAAGTGKSLVLGRIGQMVVSLDMKCIIVGSHNMSLDQVTQTVVEVLGPDSKTMVTRVYTAASDSPVLSGSNRAGPRSNVERDRYMANLFAAWKATEDTFKSKRRGMPDYSVWAHVLRNSNDENKRLMCFYTDGVDQNKKPIPVGEEVDMHSELRAFLKRLENPKTSDLRNKTLWPQEDIRKLRQCLRLCRYKVIQDTQIAICTNVVSGSREMAEFACDDNDKVVLMVDEATNMNPALTLVPLMTMYAHKIKGIYMFGDSKQLGPNPIAGTGDNNTFNEFLSTHQTSWFERLLFNGFPSSHFVVQKRQHKLIHEPVNQLHYQMGNLTTDTRLLEDLKPENENVLIDFLGLNRADTHEQIHRRYAYITIEDSAQTRPPGSSSSMNQPHIDFVTQKTRLEGIKKHYGTNTKAKVLIQVPYRGQLNAYEVKIAQLAREWGWQRNEFPNVKTIDGGIGGQADFVINDLTVEDSPGFMKNPRRDCVMASRAQDYQVIITGPLTRLWRESTTILTKFHDKRKLNYEYKVGGPINHYWEYAHYNLCWYTFKSTSIASEVAEAVDISTGDRETASNVDCTVLPPGVTPNESEVEAEEQDIDKLEVKKGPRFLYEKGAWGVYVKVD